MVRSLGVIMSMLGALNAARLVLLFAALVSIAVVSVFNDSPILAEEAMRYLFNVLTALGAAYAVETSDHIRLAVVYHLLAIRGTA